jgi:acyl-CoA synthetase (AMP-forming)/AMP-acid ligase II
MPAHAGIHDLRFPARSPIQQTRNPLQHQPEFPPIPATLHQIFMKCRDNRTMDVPPVINPPILRPAKPWRLAAYIALHARRRPGHPAIIRDGAEITYAALHRDLCAITQALRARNLAPGAIAAISHHDPYTQLLLVFGCEALGIVTGSYRPAEAAEAAGLLSLADLVLAPAMPPALHQAWLPITEAWLSAALAAPAPYVAFPPTRQDSAEVIFRSSGTTGAPKCMMLTRQAVQDRLAKQRNPELGLGLTQTSRFLAVMHLAVGSTYTAAANLLRLGGVFIGVSDIAAPTTPNAASLLTGLNPTHLTAMPRQLRAIVNALPTPPPGAGPLLPNLLVQSIGGKLPADLRAATRTRLAGQLRENYGTNELGAIGTVAPDNTIRLFPDSKAEILAPPGQPGPLRIRTAGMVTAYLNDPAATAAMFQHGWFHPGDIATLTAQNRLKLAGRNQDILNLGGAKIHAADLEAAILAHCPVTDIALVQQPDNSLIACVIPHTTATPTTLHAALAPFIPYPFRLHLLPHIPRTPEGKIQRPTLVRAVGAAAQSPGLGREPRGLCPQDPR